MWNAISVQVKTTDGAWVADCTYADRDVAVSRAAYCAETFSATRVWGHHATERGGFGNRVLWDSRDHA